MIKRKKELITLHIGEDLYSISEDETENGETCYMLYKNDGLYACFRGIFAPARYLVELWDEHEGGKQ